MKRKSVRRIKRLILTLFAAVLLNVLLLLYFPNRGGGTPAPDIPKASAGDGAAGPDQDADAGSGSTQQSGGGQQSSAEAPDSKTGLDSAQQGGGMQQRPSETLESNAGSDLKQQSVSGQQPSAEAPDSKTGLNSAQQDGGMQQPSETLETNAGSGSTQQSGGEHPSSESPVSNADPTSKQQNNNAQPSPAVGEALPPAEDAFASEKAAVTLCLTGDLMCLAGQQYTAARTDGSHDYSDSFALISDILKSCDFAIGNLETILSKSNPYSTAERLVNEQPNCNAPADYLGSLKQAGFTHLVTANNHSLDGGAVGVAETIDCLEEYEFPHTGTYRPDYTGKRYLLLEKNGIRIALLAFTELVNQRGSVAAEQLPRLIDCYGKQAAAGRIAEARADGADFVIVYTHWGSENTHEVRAYQRQHAQELADAGADLIIGSHPHCLQEQEELTASDGRSVPCFYSLGNVVSSMTRDINHDTVLVLLTLQRGDSGLAASGRAEAAGAFAPEEENTAPIPENAGVAASAVSIRKLELVPCHVLRALNGKYRVITPVSGSVDDKNAAAELAAAGERIYAIFPESGGITFSSGPSELLQ